MIGVVIRTAQDHAQGMAAHASVTCWTTCTADHDPFALMAIAAELPEQALALASEREVTARIVTGLAARGD